MGPGNLFSICGNDSKGHSDARRSRTAGTLKMIFNSRPALCDVLSGAVTTKSSITCAGVEALICTSGLRIRNQ